MDNEKKEVIKKINIGVPVDEELFELVKNRSKEFRISKAALVRMVLAKYFNQKGEF